MSDEKEPQEKPIPTVTITKAAEMSEHQLVSVVCNLKDRVATYSLAGESHHFEIDEELEHALLMRVEAKHEG